MKVVHPKGLVQDVYRPSLRVLLIVTVRQAFGVCHNLPHFLHVLMESAGHQRMPRSVKFQKLSHKAFLAENMSLVKTC